MNIDDLKDQVTERLSGVWATIQESSLYATALEKFQTMSHTGQRGLIAGAGLVVVILLFLIPYSYFSSSSDQIADFEYNRSVIRDLLKASKMAKSGEALPDQLSISDLRSRVQSELSSFQLLPEQIGDIQELLGGKKSLAKPPIKQAGITINLKQLNLEQAVSIGHRLQQLNSSVKMVGLQMTANRAKGNYFDVIYKLASFSLPAPPPDKTPSKRRGK